MTLKKLYLQITVKILFLISSLVVSLYYRSHEDMKITSAIDETKDGIEQRIRLECEREQQETLLLSVIPAHVTGMLRNIPT